MVYTRTRVYSRLLVAALTPITLHCGEAPSFSNRQVSSGADAVGTTGGESTTAAAPRSSGGGVIGSGTQGGVPGPEQTSPAPASPQPSLPGSPGITGGPVPVSGTPSGPGATPPSPPVVSPVSPPPGSPNAVLPPACDPAAGATQAQLKSVSGTAAAVTIVYRVYRTTCAGVTLALTADSILFDVDAVVASFTPISFSLAPDVATENSGTQTGTMNEAVGADLFGDHGASYAYWETNQAVSIVSANAAVELTITTAFVSSRQSDGLHTYLAFGKAAPVTVVVPVGGL